MLEKIKNSERLQGYVFTGIALLVIGIIASKLDIDFD